MMMNEGHTYRPFKNGGRPLLLALSFIIFHLSFSPAGAQTQSGKASFYSRKATGSQTANGERLHHDSLTCAHRSYPFGTLLRVTNLSNGKQVVVRVNDRGPFRRGRIIDLSWGAAREIGMIAQGIVPVTVEKLSETSIPFMPDPTESDIPLYDFEIADIAAEGITPIWQQKISPPIDPRKAQRSMNRTAAESAKDILDAIQSPPTITEHQEAKDQEAAFDEINNHPQSAKAYLKRAGKR